MLLVLFIVDFIVIYLILLWWSVHGFFNSVLNWWLGLYALVGVHTVGIQWFHLRIANNVDNCVFGFILSIYLDSRLCLALFYACSVHTLLYLHAVFTIGADNDLYSSIRWLRRCTILGKRTDIATDSWIQIYGCLIFLRLKRYFHCYNDSSSKFEQHLQWSATNVGALHTGREKATLQALLLLHGEVNVGWLAGVVVVDGCVRPAVWIDCLQLPWTVRIRRLAKRYRRPHCAADLNGARLLEGGRK